MNPEHLDGSREQALAFFNEQIEGGVSEPLADLLRNLYNFTRHGSQARVMQPVPLKNGKVLYLTGEIR